MSSNLRLPEQNSVTLIGRLTRDPEVRFTGKGQPVCSFDIAVNRRYRDTAGNWQDSPTYISIVVWGESASRCGERLKKGHAVHVEGRLQSRSWETKEGQKRTTIEVVARRVQFLTRLEGEAEAGGAAAGAPMTSGVKHAAPAEEPAAAMDDEEIPF
jgi:single-strand DNA-binding protein